LPLVDANIFLYNLTKSPKREFEVSQRILQRIEDGEEAFTTTLIVQEVADWLEYNGRRQAVPTFVTSVNSYGKLRKVEGFWADMVHANDFMKEFQLSFVDVVSIAIMERIGEKQVYSNDLDFDRVKWIERIFK